MPFYLHLPLNAPSFPHCTEGKDGLSGEGDDNGAHLGTSNGHQGVTAAAAAQILEGQIIIVILETFAPVSFTLHIALNTTSSPRSTEGKDDDVEGPMADPVPTTAAPTNDVAVGNVAAGVVAVGIANSSEQKEQETPAPPTAQKQRNYKLPKKRKKFGPTRDGRPNKSTNPSSRSRRNNTNQAGGNNTNQAVLDNGVESEVESLKKLTKDKLLRKARDLLHQQVHNRSIIDLLKAEAKQLSAKIATLQDASEKLKSEHLVAIKETFAAFENRVQARLLCLL